MKQLPVIGVAAKSASKYILTMGLLFLIECSDGTSVPPRSLVNELVFNDSKIILQLPQQDSYETKESLENTVLGAVAIKLDKNFEDLMDGPLGNYLLTRNLALHEVVYQTRRQGLTGSRTIRSLVDLVFYSETFLESEFVQECDSGYCWTVADRVLNDITFENSYKREMSGAEVDVYAITFDYNLEIVDNLSNLTSIPQSFEGNARFFKDLDDGRWKLDELTFSDDGEKAILSLFEEGNSSFLANINVEEALLGRYFSTDLRWTAEVYQAPDSPETDYTVSLTTLDVNTNQGEENANQNGQTRYLTETIFQFQLSDYQGNLPNTVNLKPIQNADLQTPRFGGVERDATINWFENRIRLSFSPEARGTSDISFYKVGQGISFEELIDSFWVLDSKNLFPSDDGQIERNFTLALEEKVQGGNDSLSSGNAKIESLIINHEKNIYSEGLLEREFVFSGDYLHVEIAGDLFSGYIESYDGSNLILIPKLDGGGSRRILQRTDSGKIFSVPDDYEIAEVSEVINSR